MSRPASSQVSVLLKMAKSMGMATHVRTVRGELRVRVSGRFAVGQDAVEQAVKEALADTSASLNAIVMATGLRREAVALALDRMLIDGDVDRENGLYQIRKESE